MIGVYVDSTKGDRSPEVLIGQTNNALSFLFFIFSKYDNNMEFGYCTDLYYLLQKLLLYFLYYIN